jgi:hypothetical protein
MKSGAKAAHLQIVPADLTLHPGEKAELTVYAYDDRGHRIGTVKADWSLAGVRPPVFPAGMQAPKATGKPAAPPSLAGALSAASGSTVSFTAAKAPNGQFGRIVAKVGDLTGEARVRVAPNLPYTQDFEKVPEGRTPAAWVNAPGKFSVVKLADGNKVLSKRNDTSNAIINQANTYITAPNTRDYDIECDVYGTKVRDKEMPDMGIGVNRYVLVLLGNDQQVRLVTWDAQKRIEKLAAFKWKPGAWYRMKLTMQVDNGKAVVRGKVWEKGQKEPEKWTVEITDPVPIREGAAMLYGYAQGSISAKDPGPNIYYDNLRITPRGKK